MDTHHVGARMRIKSEHSLADGMECTIVEISDNPNWSERALKTRKKGDRGYRVNVDGIGTIHPKYGTLIGFVREELVPIIKRPEMSSWHEIEKLCGWNPTKEVQRV